MVEASTRGGAMPRDDMATSGSVSRRQIIKRVGTGTALVWSAPALMSIAAPAFAQASPSCRLLTAGICSGSPDLTCDEAGCPPMSSTCVCGRTLDGSCFCASGGLCRTTDPPICQSDADCESLVGPGFKCAELDPCTGSLCAGRRICVSPCQSGPAPSTPRREGLITVFGG
jgi:hypothetical protein